MGRKGLLLIPAITIAIMADFALSVPISIIPNAERTLRSVNQPQTWTSDGTNNLLLPGQNDTVMSQREHTGDGAFSTDDGDGSGEGVNGTVSNDTRVSSRFSQNETEPCSLEPAILCSTVDPTFSNRDRHRRIVHIVNYLWTNVFKNRTSTMNKESLPRYNPLNPTGQFSGGLETITASCDLPSEVEGEAWSSEKHFSLYFNLTTKYPDLVPSPEITPSNTSEPRQQAENASNESGYSQEYLPVIGTQPLFTTLTVTPRRTINIVSAKLKLYKLGTDESGNTLTLATAGRHNSEPCNDTETATGSDEEVMPSVFPTKRVTFTEYAPSIDEKIRVSVFWYTQPAIKNHYKKKLVDAKMISVKESGWIEFDIKNAATAWLNERKPNYGLVIEVENENQDTLDPRLYFGDAPCFQTENAEVGKVQPGRSQESGNTMATALSPYIEICILNIPETTTSYEHTRYFPYSMNSFSHLQRVAESHAKSNHSNSSFNRPRLDNINLRAFSPESLGIVPPRNDNDSNGLPTQTIIVPNTHRRRHHHGLEGESSNTQADSAIGRHTRRRANQNGVMQQYTLEHDHPLRQILASVNTNSRETKKGYGGPFMPMGGKRLPPHMVPEMPADEGRTDYTDDDEQDVIITKIIISPGQLQKGMHAKGMFPLTAAPTSTISSTISSVSAER